MILTATAILFLALLFTGIGLLFPWSLHRREARFENLLLAFWTGWALTLGFLQLWHFVLPVGPAAFLVALAAGLAGWYAARGVLRQQARLWKPGRTLLLAGLGILPAFMLANHVMFVPYAFNIDHGLYHMQSVEWNSQYALVPGLGNLHHRLAFNNANFLYTAMVNWGPLAQRAYYVSNTLLLYALMLGCAAGFYRLFQGINMSRLFYALMIPVVLEQASSFNSAGYSPDVPVFALHIVLAGEFLRLYELDFAMENFWRRAAEMAVLVGAGIAVKLSFGAFGLLLLLAVVVLWGRRFRQHARRHWKRPLAWAGLCLVLVLPWVARNAVLSGYPLYPLAAFAMPAAWTMPDVLVGDVAPIITYWARTVSDSIPYTADLAWLSAWWARFPFVARQALFITLAASLLNLVLLARWWRQKFRPWGSPKPHLGSAALWGISLLALVYWFALGPTYRFSGALIWVLLISALLFGFHLLAAGGRALPPLRPALAIVIVFSLWLSPNHLSNNLSRAWFFSPPPETQHAEGYQSAALAQERQTASGLTVYTPPGESSECLHIPLPCTPPADFLTTLRLIEPGNVQRGFSILR
jgi:hypothetical protein